jgi:proteasome lid subunit RPN8/RPN11
MLILELSPEHEKAIAEHGERAYPNECCGFLLGRDDGTVRHTLALREAGNESDANEQYHRFSISPEDFMAADRDARQRKMDVVGFYHSHPNAPARPSPVDQEHAWPVYSYVIVSVHEREARERTSWVLRDDRSGYDEQTIRRS